MEAFFDTSALVPLLLDESQSDSARAACHGAEAIWAWRWAQVEAEAALIRRKANPATWNNWRRLADRIRWLEFSDQLIPDLCRFNREIGLRAVDAGHLFVFERSLLAIPNMRLVTFDKEMARAATDLKLPLWES